jgi:signal transduction histidine kinase
MALEPRFHGPELLEEVRLHNEELMVAGEALREQNDALARSVMLLERERSKYVDLFTHAPEAYVLTDLTGVVQEANAAGGALFSADPRFLRGRLLVSFVARGDTRAFRDLVRSVAEAPSPAGAHPFSMRMRPRGQPVFPCSGRVALLVSPTGKRIALRWILRHADPGPSREAHASLEFFREMALDLRRTSTTIAEFARVLAQHPGDADDGRRQAVEWIARSAAAQGALLDDLAELNALREEGPASSSSARFDLAERLRNVASRLRGEDLERVSVDAAVVPPPVVGAVHEIDRGIELLVRRALDGTPRTGGRVRVSTALDGTEALVRVEAPDGSSVPAGWAVRTATIACVCERSGGRLVLDDPAPSGIMCLPLAR